MIGVFLAVFIIVVGITRYVSLGSLIVVWYFPLYVILEYHRIETSLFVIMLFQFITAATGMAAMAGIMKAMAAKTTKTIGNFWYRT